MMTHWIGGESTPGTSTRTSPVFNPATGEITRELPLANAADLDAAVKVAKDAFGDWRRTSLGRRAEILFKARAIFDDRRAELADIVSSEHGKVPSDAMGEIARGLENVEFACGIPNLLKGGFSEQVASGVDVFSIRQPLGVVAGITPFNFPAMVPMWMFANAIACGNTFILKPSEKDPSASMFIAEVLAEAGLPAGVFNVVHGDKEAVDAILTHPDIAAVSFVGSTPIARYIYETGTANGKRVQALGGAKNHMIVLPDADIDSAADAAISAAYGSAGERCMAISALVVVDTIADALIAKITERMATLKTGDGSTACDMGPIVTGVARDRIVGYIQAGVAAGASLVVDGRETQFHGAEGGFFVGPTLFDNVATDMSIYTDEIFGPVLSVVRVASYDEGLALINSSLYGNGTAIFTNDGGAARRFQNEVQVGMIGINVPIPVPMAYYSFGGWKASLFGDSHAHGMEGVHFFTRTKAVTQRWLDPSHGGLNLGFPQNK